MSFSEQLRILSIFHYVVGGLHVLFSSFGLIHFFIGLSLIVNPSAWGPQQNTPPLWFGYIFAIVGAAFVLIGWTLGILTIISGRFIARRTNRQFSIVMGAVNCAMLPLGTVLGVFAIILLMKDEAKTEYAEGAAPNP